MGNGSAPLNTGPSAAASLRGMARRSRLFEGLDDAQLESVLSLGAQHRFDQSTVIVREADEDASVYLLLQGRVNAELRHPFLGGDPQVLGTIEAGETFGEMHLVDRKARSASCRAIEPVAVLRIGVDELESLMTREPAIGFHVMRNTAALVAARLRDLNEKMQRAMIDLFYF